MFKLLIFFQSLFPEFALEKKFFRWEQVILDECTVFKKLSK